MTEAKLKDYKYASGNYFEDLTTKEGVAENWPTLLEGLTNVNDPRRADGRVNLPDFVKVMLRSAHEWPSAFLGILKSKNGKPLGYLCAYDDTHEFCSNKTLWVYIVYSTSKYKATISEMLSFIQDFAKFYKFDRIQAASGRVSGAAFYWYEKKLGFRRRYIIFEKDMTK